MWAFGAVLYEMLTAQKPFVGDDVSDTLAAVLRAEVNLDELPDETPARVRHAVSACLQRDPKERVHDIADVRLAIRGAFETAVSATSEPGDVPTLPAWQRPVSIAVVALACLVVGGVAVWSLIRPASPRVARFPIPLAADQVFTFTGRPIVAVSPDGSHVVYAANDGLWLRPVDQLMAFQLPGTEGEARAPFFSADGQSIGFYAEGQLKKVSVSGGAPVTVADGVRNTYGASWGADDTILYGQPEGIMRGAGREWHA